MADRKRYTVLVPYPLGGGHWSRKGQILELLDVQAQQLETAGRIAPAPAEEVPAPAGKTKTEKAAE